MNDRMSYRPQASYWREAIACAPDDDALLALALVLADELDEHDAQLARNGLPSAFCAPPECDCARSACEVLVVAIEWRKALFRACGWWPPKGVWAPGEREDKRAA